MPPLSNPRHEKFAAFIADGKTASEAYVLAGYKNNKWAHSAAGQLLKRCPHIKERAIQISVDLAAAASTAKQITLERLIEWHDEIRNLGKQSGQLSPAETAIKEISVLTGHRIERSEVGAPGEFEAMEDGELERALLDRFARLGLAALPDGGIERVVDGNDTEH